MVPLTSSLMRTYGSRKMCPETTEPQIVQYRAELAEMMDAAQLPSGPVVLDKIVMGACHRGQPDTGELWHGRTFNIRTWRERRQVGFVCMYKERTDKPIREYMGAALVDGTTSEAICWSNDPDLYRLYTCGIPIGTVRVEQRASRLRTCAHLWWTVDVGHRFRGFRGKAPPASRYYTDHITLESATGDAIDILTGRPDTPRDELLFIIRAITLQPLWRTLPLRNPILPEHAEAGFREEELTEYFTLSLFFRTLARPNLPWVHEL
jgi:hypothetical protein